MKIIAGFVTRASARARQKRAEVFRKTFSLNSKTKLLDLGLEDGSNIAAVLADADVKPENVFIADIEKDKLEIGHKRYGFTPVLLDESGEVPYPDQFSI